MPLEAGRDLGPVRRAVTGERAELGIEGIASPGRVHDDHLGGLVGEVEEGVRQTGGHERETASLQYLLLVVYANLEAAGENVERLLLLMMDMKRRTAVRCDFHHEVVEGSGRVVAGDLEDEVAPGAGLQPQPFFGRPERSVVVMGILVGRI